MPLDTFDNSDRYLSLNSETAKVLIFSDSVAKSKPKLSIVETEKTFTRKSAIDKKPTIPVFGKKMKKKTVSKKKKI